MGQLLSTVPSVSVEITAGVPNVQLVEQPDPPLLVLKQLAEQPDASKTEVIQFAISAMALIDNNALNQTKTEEATAESKETDKEHPKTIVRPSAEHWSVPETTLYDPVAMSFILEAAYKSSVMCLDTQEYKSHKKCVAETPNDIPKHPFQQARTCLHFIAHAFPLQLISALNASFVALSKPSSSTEEEALPEILSETEANTTALQFERFFNALDSVERQLVCTHLSQYQHLPILLLKRFLAIYPRIAGHQRKFLTILARYVKRCPRVLRAHHKLLYTVCERVCVEMMSDKSGPGVLSRAASNTLVTLLTRPIIRSAMLSPGFGTLRMLVDNIPGRLAILPEKNGRKLVIALNGCMRIHGKAAQYPGIGQLILDLETNLKAAKYDHFLPIYPADAPAEIIPPGALM